MKSCTQCQEMKALSEFHRNAARSDGRKGQCKECCRHYRTQNKDRLKAARPARTPQQKEETKKYNAIYHAANKKKANAVSKAYKKANKESIAKQRAEYREENRERGRAECAIYYAANTEAITARAKIWRKENAGVMRIHAQNRRAKQRESGGRLSHGLAAKLYALQKGKCPCCQKPLGDNYHMDHIMPLALGGPHEDGNIQLLRQKCNNQKYAKHPVDFMQQRGFLL